MSIDDLKIYIEAQIENLKKFTDTNDFVEGYIRALEDTLKRIEDGK